MTPDVDSLIKSFGYLGVWTIIFAETGILFGVLLPGDSLLIAAGILAAQGHFDIGIMAFGCFVAAMIGNLVGYELGGRWGKPFLEKYGPQLTTPQNIAKTYKILRRYQKSGIVVSRFLPAARTFAPFLAGVIRMRQSSFILYSFIGAVIWGAGLPVLGYYVGGILPPSFMEYLMIPVLVLILGAVLWPYCKKRFKKRSPLEAALDEPSDRQSENQP